MTPHALPARRRTLVFRHLCLSEEGAMAAVARLHSLSVEPICLTVGEPMLSRVKFEAVQPLRLED